MHVEHTRLHFIIIVLLELVCFAEIAKCLQFASAFNLSCYSDVGPPRQHLIIMRFEVYVIQYTNAIWTTGWIYLYLFWLR